MLLLTLTQGNVDDISKGLGLVVVLMTAVFASAAAQIGVEPETILYGMIPTVPKGAGVLALSVIGTTAIPFNLFLASAIAKGNTVKSMRTGMKLATCVAAVASTFIMIVGTGVKETSGAFTVHELGLTLRETVGEFATKCFAFGLLAAAFSASLGCTLGASVSIAGLNSTAGDDIGPGEEVLESVLDEDELWGKKSTNAMRLLCWCTFVGWLTAALQLPTVPVVLTAQVINGCLLPYLSYSLLICVNDPTIMANQPQTAGQNVHGLLATFVTMMLACVVIITKFFGWAIPSEDHPIVFIGAFIMAVIGMDTAIKDVRKARSPKNGTQLAREVVVAQDRLEFLSNNDAF
jgi:Mn2+/Fe2+ NRAMP family transporter